MRTEVVKTDVLVIGGGIAGLMAAIRASELGVKVVVAEKGNTISSGKGGAGCDHYLCYIPEVHGTDMDAYIEEMLQTQQAVNFRGLGMKRMRTHLATSFDVVKLWDNWGIPMKNNGKYEFAGHAFPGGFLCLLKYQGGKQKAVLTEQTLKRGVEIINRVMVFDLFSDENRAGAVGIDTRQDRFIEFEAKEIVLGTGAITRLVPSITPGMVNNLQAPMTLTADGRLMAYRAGAELRDVEMPRFHCGPKYFARAGQASWIGVFRDPQGKPIGPFVTKPEKKYGDITPEVDKAIFSKYMKSGRGPVYMDGRGMSEDEYEYMKFWLMHEGNESLLNHMEEEGIDYRKNPIEFMTYDLGPTGRIQIDERSETTIKGVYAAGDEVANGASNASVFGWIIGEDLAKNAKDRTSPIKVETKKAEIEEKKGLLKEIRKRKGGPTWWEVNIALQQIIRDYAGEIRSEAMLEAGLGHLRRLRDKALNTVIANDHHELVRCLEVMNLLEMGELVFIAADDRKETRGFHVRSDYELPNPRLNNKVHVVKKINGKPVTDWQAVRK